MMHATTPTGPAGPPVPSQTSSTKARLVRLSLASAFSAAMLWLLLRKLDMQQLWQHLRAVQAGGLCAYMALLCVTQVARAWRWQTLLLPIAPVDWRSAWRMSNVGNMMIMLLPLRLGEFTRPLLLRSEYGRPLSTGLGAAVIERVLDGLLVTLLFFATTALLPQPFVVPSALWAGALVALVLFGGASVGILAMLVVHDRFVGLVERIGRSFGPTAFGVVEKLLALLEAFVTGMRALPNVRAVASVVTSTLLYWGANAAGMACLLGAFGWPLPWLAGATLVCVLVIGVMIPAGPGLLGTYQAALVAGLSVYRVPYDQAVAFSLVAYLGNVLVLVGFGLPHILLARRPQ